MRNCARNLLRNEAAIHILVNNAGAFMPLFQKTEDGYELTLQTNYLGHFLLTLLLLPKMQSSSPGCRIVNVSSMLHFCKIVGDFEKKEFISLTELCFTNYLLFINFFIIYSCCVRKKRVQKCFITVGDINFDDINLERSCTQWNAYNQTKLANILFTKELAHRLQSK